MMSGSHSSSTSTTKRIVVAAAVASSTGFLAGPVSANVPSQAQTPTSKSSLGNGKIQQTPWGIRPQLWEEVKTDDTSNHPLASLPTLKIPRGGTDETPDKSDKKKDPSSKKKKSRKTDNKHKKKGKPQSRSKNNDVQEEEEPINDDDSSKNGLDNPVVEEILESEDYYDILGLPQGEDNIARIKKAYRRRAVKTHPDKTDGDRRAFDKLAEAYDVLLDNDKRALYDRYGKAGLDPHGGAAQGASSAEDLFRSFFGQQRSRQQQRGGGVNQTLQYQYAVSLEDLYQGATHKVTVRAPTQQPFRGFMYQEPSQPKEKEVEVTIPRGSFGGQNIHLSGEMDFNSDEAPPGDLVFQLQVRPHKIFTRKGHDLAMTITISLSEAICGCTRTIQHLDGRSVTIESAKHFLPTPTMMSPTDTDGPTLNDLEDTTASAPFASSNDDQITNVYIQTGDVQVLKGQGMPKDQHGHDYGDLYVIYKVELPKAQSSMQHLTPSERMELARLLEKLEGKDDSNNNKQQSTKKGKNKSPSQTFVLEPAKISDIGHASGIPNLHEEDPLNDHDHQGQQHHPHFPFGGMGHRQFFYSSTGQSPFFGQESNFEDDENVHCRQM